MKRVLPIVVLGLLVVAGVFVAFFGDGPLMHGGGNEGPPAAEAPTRNGESAQEHDTTGADTPGPTAMLLPHPRPDTGIVARGERFDYSGLQGYKGRRNFWLGAVEHVLARYNGMTSDLKRAAAEGDGEAAYVVYAFLAACANAPVTDKEARTEEAEYADWITRNPEAEEDFLRAHARKLFEACTAVDRVALTHETYAWLTLAADLGYAPAIESYLWGGQDLALKLAFRGDTGRVGEYRTRAWGYLERWLSSGHPQAFWTAFDLARQGRLEPVDFVAARAYLRAAELIVPEENAELEARVEWIETRLGPSQIREARKRGRELCRQYVPRECGG